MAKLEGGPVKSFFVKMLTRDIPLSAAMLDLLDNCIDGVQRISTDEILQKKKPYIGKWAKIDFSKDGFTIKDNCGGIPWGRKDEAFMLGRINPKFDKGKKQLALTA